MCEYSPDPYNILKKVRNKNRESYPNIERTPFYDINMKISQTVF